jgi:hypothetical protein
METERQASELFAMVEILLTVSYLLDLEASLLPISLIFLFARVAADLGTFGKALLDEGFSDDHLGIDPSNLEEPFPHSSSLTSEVVPISSVDREENTLV